MMLTVSSRAEVLSRRDIVGLSFLRLREGGRRKGATMEKEEYAGMRRRAHHWLKAKRMWARGLVNWVKSSPDGTMKYSKL